MRPTRLQFSLSLITALTLGGCLSSVKPKAPAAPMAAAKDSTEINWQEWSDADFEKAKAQNKLVILDLQAVWCHWCHVMEDTTYKDPEIRKYLDDHFIAVRVDQDARPDISHRYEDYGWPATVVFNGNGLELAKRQGYIEPDEMKTFLKTIVAHPVVEKPDVERKPISAGKAGVLSEDLEKHLEKYVESKYDKKLGAWKIGHKFLDAEMTEWFLRQGLKGNKKLLKYAVQTLNAQQVLFDPAWGGVYQYSAGGNWHEPHFEKIMSVQTDNIKIYSLAYAQLHDPKYLSRALEAQKFLIDFLKSPDGGFYTSQDADLVQGEHGGSYFSLSDSQRRKIGLPRIDKHIYARENGWAIQALLALYSVNKDPKNLQLAQATAEFIIKKRSLKDGGFRHDESDVAGPYLGDSLSMGAAFLDLYRATGDRVWLDRTQAAANFIDKTFKNQNGAAGFFTSISASSKVLGNLIEADENSQLGRWAFMLYQYTRNNTFKDMALRAMAYVSSWQIAEDIFVASELLLFNDELKSDPVHITIVGHKDDELAQTLHFAALAYPSTYKQIDWWDKREGPIPYTDLSYPEMKTSVAFACAHERCSLPAFKSEEVAQRVQSLMK